MDVKGISKLVKTILVLLIFPISVVSAQDVQQEKWSLEECIAYALENNLNIKLSEYTVDDSKIQFSQSKAGMFPSANMGGGFTDLWGRSIDPTTNRFTTQEIRSFGLQLSASYTLYGGSQLRNTLKQNRLNMASASFDLEKAKNDVMLNVTLAFLNVILNIELLENAQLQLETTKAQLETTSKQVEFGALPYSNELDLIAQVESNEVQVINADNNVRISYLNLKQLLLLPADTPFEIEIPDIENVAIEEEPTTTTEVFEVAQSIMPEIKSVDLLVESAQVGVKIARGGMDPRLTLGGNMYSNYSSAANRERFVIDPDGGSTIVPTQIGYVINPLDPAGPTIPVFNDVEIPAGDIRDTYPIADQLKDNWSYSLNLNLYIPIFNGSQARSFHQRAKIYADQSKVNAQQVRQNLRQTIEIAYTDAQAASKTYNASIKQVESLEESFRAAEKSYNLGAMNIYDYQVASNNLFRARSDLLRNKYNFIFTSKVLDFYLGKPLSLD
jgi:outer membrane protein